MRSKRPGVARGVLAVAIVICATVVAVSVGGAGATNRTVADTPASGCQLANGVKHVIDIVFDNVHVNRDNPNVLSDIEQIPSLYHFITQNGTLLSNNHTPMIGHTANDLVTNFTGLYGDRQGMGVSNDYYAFTPSGGVTPEQSVFSYWTGGGADSYPQMDYSATVPPTGGTTAPPAPWVPFTRAGCNVGGVSSVNMELENVNPDIQNVFGASSPEAGAVQRRFRFVQGSRGQRLHRPRRPLRQGLHVLRRRQGREVRADVPVEHRGRGRPAGRAGRL